MILTGDIEGIEQGSVFYYSPGKSISYYIGLARGIKNTGDIKKYLILSLDGKIKEVNIYYTPEKGDTIIIKKNKTYAFTTYFIPLATFIVSILNLYK